MSRPSLKEPTWPRLDATDLGELLLEEAELQQDPDFWDVSLPGEPDLGLAPLEDDIRAVEVAHLQLMELPDEPASREALPTHRWVSTGSHHAPPVVPADAHLIGHRYRVEAELGKGGMSRIFRVSHVNMGRQFALKIILDDLATDPQIRNHFEREAWVLSQLEHPHVVQITDFGVDDDVGAFIVMEYLRGENLHERLHREGRLPVSLALDLALQAADALAYIHQRDLVHCDVKAENVLLVPGTEAQRRRPSVKIIDFGLSRTRAAGAQLYPSEVGGTPQYMAPEQIRRSAPTPSMDIYALGVLLFEMLTGQLPFTGTLRQVITGQLDEPPPSPSTLLPASLDERLEDLILRALAKDPERRHPTMRHFIFELRTVMDMLGLGRSRGLQSLPTVDAARPAVTAHPHCQACPFPIFRVDEQHRLVMTNPAFDRFVRREQEHLQGVSVHETRLPSIYPTLRSALRDVLQDHRMVQRVLRFRPAGGPPVSVMASLVPERSVDGAARSVYGMVMPLDDELFSCVEVE